MVYKDIWLSAGLVDEVASLTNCHPRTVKRWLKNGVVPDGSYALIDVIQNGRLEKIHPDWQGWRICNRTGQLWTPTGEKVHATQILSLQYRLAQIRCLERRLKVQSGQSKENQHTLVAVS